MKHISKIILCAAILALALPNKVGAQEVRENPDSLFTTISNLNKNIEMYNNKLKEKKDSINLINSLAERTNQDIKAQKKTNEMITEMEERYKSNCERIGKMRDSLAMVEQRIAQYEKDLSDLSVFSKKGRDKELGKIDILMASHFKDVKKRDIENAEKTLERLQAFDDVKTYRDKFNNFKKYWNLYRRGQEAKSSKYDEKKVVGIQLEIYEIYDSYDADTTILTKEQFKAFEDLELELAELNNRN